MTSYAEIAAKNPTSASQSNKARESMESLGQIRRSPSRRDHFRAPPQMEDSVLLAEEVPTCNVERLLYASTPSTPLTGLEKNYISYMLPFLSSSYCFNLYLPCTN